ncbi:hypothetical protein [Mycobacterium sp.]|uniref:hypothetical protein n=1 Tax=Mycobacterium sp. TaxID=1785 RepID=UPI002BAC11AB|nr:hypothetical protein [Mycobacterium sp.]HTQ22057.1 hypothetical protein [Mycobacterium sp.]
MHITHVAAAAGAAVTALFIAPSMPTALPSAHADYDGYSRCVGHLAPIPLNAPDLKNSYLMGVVEQDLKSGVPPAGEAQKVTQMGYEPRLANGIVQCVMQHNP